MQLTSDLFQDSAAIPAPYTCKGQNTSPSLHISEVPNEARSLALVLHDPDAPHGDFLHWAVWNIDPKTAVIEENTVPTGARQGLNGFGKVGYGGPCPPSGTHRYMFELYALDILLDIAEGADRQTVETALNAHTIASARLTGLFSA